MHRYSFSSRVSKIRSSPFRIKANTGKAKGGCSTKAFFDSIHICTDTKALQYCKYSEYFKMRGYRKAYMKI